MPVVPDELRDRSRRPSTPRLEERHRGDFRAADWITLRVSCRRITADRMTRLRDRAGERRARLGSQRSGHGVSRSAAERDGARRGIRSQQGDRGRRVRTARTIVYYFKDPGPGFNPKAPGLVATEDDPLSHLTYREAEGKRPADSACC
jgi:hypothetical protein